MKRKPIPLDQSIERREALKAALVDLGADVLIDLHQGPDHQGRHSFTAYWFDTYLSPPGMHAQVFRTTVSEFVERYKKKDKIVKFCPQELHEEW